VSEWTAWGYNGWRGAWSGGTGGGGGRGLWLLHRYSRDRWDDRRYTDAFFVVLGEIRAWSWSRCWWERGRIDARTGFHARYFHRRSERRRESLHSNIGRHHPSLLSSDSRYRSARAEGLDVSTRTHSMIITERSIVHLNWSAALQAASPSADTGETHCLRRRAQVTDRRARLSASVVHPSRICRVRHAWRQGRRRHILVRVDLVVQQVPLRSPMCRRRRHTTCDQVAMRRL